MIGRPPGTGVGDADLFYVDENTSWDAEDVHLWYEERFGVPARPFRDCADAIDSFAAVCWCYGLTKDRDGQLRVHAPYGYDDLFSLTVRPTMHGPAPRHVYEAKTTRWSQQWPEVTVVPWDERG